MLLLPGIPGISAIVWLDFVLHEAFSVRCNQIKVSIVKRLSSAIYAMF